MQTQETVPQPRIRLTEARNRKGWSQQELANQIGTTHVNVSRWERGITRPSPYFRRKLCAIYGKSEQELDLARQPESDSAENPHSAIDVGAGGQETSSPYEGVPIYDPAIPLPSAIRLVGREAELTELKQRLYAGGSVALTALNGLPGVGKTTLAITLAHDPDVRARFRDGVLWAGLGPTPNLPGLLSRWGTLLGISSTEMASLNSSEAWAMALRTAIGARRMLLLIDDAWEVEEALTFKVGGPNCAHMVTTRFPGIAMHVAGGGATVLKELNEDESMALLGILAPTVVSREAQRAHDLVHAVGGLPLALTLIGNYLRMQAYSGQARRITQALERLSDAEVRLHISEPRGPVERHPSLPTDASLSLQSVIAVTDQQLDEPARQTLYALSVFPPKPNSFSEEAALAVTGLSVDALDAIIDFGMLEGSGSDRYTLHQIIADYARVHLKRIPRHDRYDRLITYMIGYIEAHKKDYELLDLESSNIHAALELAFDLGREPELVRGVCAFAPFLLLRGLYTQAEKYLGQAHEAAQNVGDEKGITEVLLYMGQVALKQGHYEQARMQLQRAYEIAMAGNDHNGITNGLLYLGQLAAKQGDYIQAEDYLQKGLILARQSREAEKISSFLNDLGNLTWKKGEYEQAEQYLQEGLLLARKLGNRERICSFLKILGSLFSNKGDYNQAENYLQEGLTIARQIGDREQSCVLLMNLGATFGEQGDYTKAITSLLEGLTLARQMGHREWTSALLSNLGSVELEQGSYIQAEIYFQEGLELARQIENREWISGLLMNLGVTARKQGDFGQAEALFQESIDLARQIGRAYILAYALHEYGNLLLDKQKTDEAELIFREMLTVVPKGGQDLLALAQYGLAQVEADKGNIEIAQKLGEDCITVLEAMGNRKAEEIKEWLSRIKNV